MATGKKLAKQARLDERAAIIQRKAQIEARNRNIVIAVFVVLIVGGGGLLYLLTNPPAFLAGPPTPTTHTAALSIPDEGATHVAQGTALTHAHNPPSSGNHYPTPLPAGAYSTIQPEGNWVHSLEHGYIVLVYKCSGSECNDLYQQAKAVFAALPKESKFNEVKFVSTEYNNMTPKIAVLAWDKEEDMSSIDANLITSFYKQYVDHGREDLA
ncbi:MAG TPA: DUF3105 domain-containing protein [Candidatus Solibacter sp.]|nr:DUF3105 domain-containing protein [Candidatus Solibacter sp.]